MQNAECRMQKSACIILHFQKCRITLKCRKSYSKFCRIPLVSNFEADFYRFDAEFCLHFSAFPVGSTQCEDLLLLLERIIRVFKRTFSLLGLLKINQWVKSWVSTIELIRQFTLVFAWVDSKSSPVFSLAGGERMSDRVSMFPESSSSSKLDCVL